MKLKVGSTLRSIEGILSLAFRNRTVRKSVVFVILTFLILGTFLSTFSFVPPAKKAQAADTNLTEDYEASSLTINPGDTFTTNGYDVIIKGNITIQGTLNATNGAGGTSTISLTGNWNSTGGTFTNTNSEVVFSGEGAQSITSDGEAFNDLTIASTGTTITSTDTLTVNGDLTVDNGYRMAVGSYIGDGVNARPIAGVGFQPDLVIIKPETLVAYTVARTVDIPGDASLAIAHTSGLTANLIESLDADGFTIGNAAEVNTNLLVYHWQAFRAVGAADFATGVYVGNNADPRDVVTGLPFRPAIVVIKQDGANRGVWKPSSLTGDLTLDFSSAAALADRIQALNADGFQVGADAVVNLLGGTYYWFAFAEVAGWIDVGSYIGNAPVDNRSITGMGFPPNLVWVKAETTTSPSLYRPSTLAGDAALAFRNLATTADWIQVLEANGFQVGANVAVNQFGITYHYAAWKETSASTLNLNGQTVDIDGDVTINDLGTLTIGAATINVGGDWVNAGTFNGNGSEVIFDGTGGQSITSGGDSFNDLTITNSSAAGVTFLDDLTLTGTFTCNTPGARLIFNAGSTYTFPSIDINGTSASHITIQSDNPGNPFFLIVIQPNPQVTYVDVSDSDASGGNEITNLGGRDLGGNDNWNVTSFPGGSGPKEPSVINLIEGQIVHGTYRIEVSAGIKKGSIKYVEFYIDDVLKYTDYQYPFYYDWDTTQYHSPHTVKIIAYDKNGRKTEISYNVLVVNELPGEGIDELPYTGA